MTTISSGSLADIIRVQLFSKPQQTQAASTNREPKEKSRLAASSKDRIMLDRVIRPMASHSRRLIFSRKTIRAMRAVATISKLFSREALAEVVRVRPTMRQMGAAMSSSTIPTV